MKTNIITRYFLISITILSCLGMTAQSFGETLSLPSLTGNMELGSWVEPNFGYPCQRECDFVIPENITAIEDMFLVLSGQWLAGEIYCNTGFEEPEISPYLPPIVLTITSDAFPGDYFISMVTMPDGPFDSLLGTFESSYPPGVLEFDDLIGADLHAELLIDSLVIGMCSISIDSYGILDQVDLQILTTVPTDTFSFGQIKSLYR